MDTISLIAQIHATPVMTVIVVSGGGTQAIADLLAVPGASRTLLEALVPYSEKSLAAFIGVTLAQAVSLETAKALAHKAYQRAEQLRENPNIPVLGLSCTATLVTDRPKKGTHRAHVGTDNGAQQRVYSLTLKKGVRDRSGEERVVSNLLLHAFAEACVLNVTVDLALLPGERIVIQEE